jgi:putative transposase
MCIKRNKLFQNKYRIRSARCCNWDYGWNAIYFISICTLNRICFFGEILNNEMILSKVGKIIKKYWLEIPDHFAFVELDEFVIMPDHIHGLIAIKKNDSDLNIFTNDNKLENGNDKTKTRQCLVSLDNKIIIKNQIPNSIGSQRFRNPGRNNISSIIGSFKSVCTKNINRQFPEIRFGWQSRFHDRIVRNDKEHMRIKQYIINNPKNYKNNSKK